MMSLSSTSRGSVICRHVEGSGPEVTRLKRMGVCEGRQIDVIQAGDPMILQVVGTRIGLSRQLAAAVMVEPVSENGTCERSDAQREGGGT